MDMTYQNAILAKQITTEQNVVSERMPEQNLMERINEELRIQLQSCLIDIRLLKMGKEIGKGRISITVHKYDLFKHVNSSTLVLYHINCL